MKRPQAKEPHGKLSPRRVQQPLSITLIGLYLLFGACLMPVNMYAHAPAFLSSFTLDGWQAGAFFAAICLLDAAIGFNLLMMAPWSRTAAIWFFVFRIANTSATFAFPSSRARFEQNVLLTQRATRLGSAPTASRILFGAVIEIFIMAVAVWFLAKSTAAFPPAGSPSPREDGECV